jgi:cytochrome c2
LRPRDEIAGTALLLLVTAALVAGTAAIGMAELDAREARERAVALTGGDPERGRALLTRYGCSGCHTIPGIRRADGMIGPPLGGVADRVYLGGAVTNTPENMVAWIVDPRSIDAGTAMPVTGITAEEARDVAAYLYTLRQPD